MYIKNLNLKNIGPFKEAELNFEPITEDGKLPVIIITGENGTGKSIIIDTIRALFLGSSNSKIERHIHSSKNFQMYLNLNYLRACLNFVQ